MLPVKQVGPSETLTAGAWSAATTNGSLLLVTNPNTTLGYFMQSPTNGSAPSGTTGIPVNGGDSIIVEQANATAYWGAVTEGLIVTPVEIPRVF